MKDGTFRGDLLYRLNVEPALAAARAAWRPVAMAEFFVKKYAAANGVAEKPLARGRPPRPPARNVRELENAMHRAVLLASGPEIEEDAIRLPDGQPFASADPHARPAQAASLAAETANRGYVGQTVAAMEQQLIIDTLEHCLGNRTHAANILGISIRTLRNKLKEYSEAGVSVTAPQMGASAA